MEQRTSVIVIAGYLGAGKTTLLNRLLGAADAATAVLVNDFGDINVDAALLDREDGRTLALDNGCICCSLVDGFAVALDTIRALEPQPTTLLIEASGVADPAAVAAWGHGPGFRLDSVVTVADVERLPDLVKDRYVGQLVRQQLSAADLIILNKADLAGRDGVARATRWLAEHHPNAVITSTTNAELPATVVLGVGTDVHRSSAPPEPTDVALPLFETVTEAWPEPVLRAQLEDALRSRSNAVVRSKGFVMLVDETGDAGCHLVQAVGRRWTIEPYVVDPPRLGLVHIMRTG